MSNRSPSLFRKADAIVILAVIALAVLLFLFGLSENEASTLVISADGKETVYLLDKDTAIDIESEGVRLTITVEDGAAYVSSTTCKSAICSHSGKISRPGQIIVCAPAKVSVRIIGKGGELDAVTG